MHVLEAAEAGEYGDCLRLWEPSETFVVVGRSSRVADVNVPAGTLKREGRRVLAGCGTGSIEWIEVQLEGKKRISGEAFNSSRNCRIAWSSFRPKSRLACSLPSAM